MSPDEALEALARDLLDEVVEGKIQLRLAGELQLTPEEAKAYEILAWAQEDPERRLPGARRRLDDLARPLLAAGGQALREVQDVGWTLARLGSG